MLHYLSNYELINRIGYTLRATPLIRTPTNMPTKPEPNSLHFGEAAMQPLPNKHFSQSPFAAIDLNTMMMQLVLFVFTVPAARDYSSLNLSSLTHLTFLPLIQTLTQLVVEARPSM